MTLHLRMPFVSDVHKKIFINTWKGLSHLILVYNSMVMLFRFLVKVERELFLTVEFEDF